MMHLAPLPKIHRLVHGLLAIALLATVSCQPTSPDTKVLAARSAQNLSGAIVSNAEVEQALSGAWRLTGATGQNSAATNSVIIMVDGQFTMATYDVVNKRFIGASGGTWAYNDGRYEQTVEYNTLDSTLVGSTWRYTPDLQGNILRLSRVQDGREVQQTWEQLDPAEAPMAGAWRIEGRNPQTGGRKTIKWLSDTRFQWAAINPETKQFFGTGGGTYTVQDGKYVENIEFFSRDPNRVGMSLPFDHALQDGKWLHSGMSTAGKPIKEVWVKESR